MKVLHIILAMTYPWSKLVTYGLSVLMLKSLKLSITISATLILFICYFTKETHLRGIGLVPMDVDCWVSWGEGIETPFSTGSSWRPPSIHCLLSFTFVTFLIIWPLSPTASVSWYWSCFVCSGLAYEIYSGDGPSRYVYCVVCYRVIAAPYVRSVGHVFTYLYTLDDDSEHPMDYETSLLPTVFPPL